MSMYSDCTVKNSLHLPFITKTALENQFPCPTLTEMFHLLWLRVHIIVFLIAALMPVGGIRSGGHVTCLTGACITVSDLLKNLKHSV